MAVRQRTVLLPGWLEPPELPGLSYVFWDAGEPWPPPDQLAAVSIAIPPYLAGPDDLALLGSLPNLRSVQALVAGIDAVAPFVPPGVSLARAVGVHDASTAELAVGVMLAMQRGLDVAARNMASATWAHERLPSLADSTIGIVGWGGVGRAIAARLDPFEVKLAAFSRHARDGAADMAAFDRSLPDLDVVVLALPATPDTVGFLDATRLARIRDGGLVVNVGRGELIDTDALVAELSSGRLRAGLDVTDPEPLPPDHPLWRCPNVLITPHVGGDSAAFVPRARRFIAKRLRQLASATGE